MTRIYLCSGHIELDEACSDAVQHRVELADIELAADGGQEVPEVLAQLLLTKKLASTKPYPMTREDFRKTWRSVYLDAVRRRDFSAWPRGHKETQLPPRFLTPLTQAHILLDPLGSEQDQCAISSGREQTHHVLTRRKFGKDGYFAAIRVALASNEISRVDPAGSWSPVVEFTPSEHEALAGVMRAFPEIFTPRALADAREARYREFGRRLDLAMEWAQARAGPGYAENYRHYLLRDVTAEQGDAPAPPGPTGLRPALAGEVPCAIDLPKHTPGASPV